MRKRTVLFAVLSILFAVSVYLTLDNQADTKEFSIPRGETHWHPHLTIIINGEEVLLPDDIGYGTGRVIDTHLSGMEMSPTHTHESDGTIHIENRNPAEKPETLTLGYFFYVWNKTFNANCIFDYCTDKGTLTMSVNGKPNTEFEKYIMRDKDIIVIEYTITQGG